MKSFFTAVSLLKLLHVLYFHFCLVHSIFNSFLPLQPSIYFHLLHSLVWDKLGVFLKVIVSLAKTVNPVTTWKNNYLHLFSLTVDVQNMS